MFVSAFAFAEDVVWAWSATINTGAQITLGDSTSVPDAMIEVRNADSPNASRIRFNGAATAGNYGLNFRIASDFAGIADPAQVVAGVVDLFHYWWVTAKWMDNMVQLRAGAINNTVTDTVNNGWGGMNVGGMQLIVVPIENLSIGLGVPLSTPAEKVTSAFAGTKIGFAYTMTDLVTLRATWMNAGGENTSDFAFGAALLAVPNLTAEFEVNAVNFGDDGTVDPASGIELFQNAAYQMGALKPGITIDETLWGDSALDMTIWVKPSIDYLVMDGLNVGASIKYIMNQAGGTTSGLVVDPYAKFTFNDKAALKIDAAFTIGDLDDTSLWTLPININFLYSL
jgi:hypothetical protein